MQTDNKLTAIWVDRFVGALGEKTSTFFIIAVALTFYEVILRYFFNSPTTWVHEVSIAFTAVAFVVGGSYTLSRRDHIRITLIYDMLPPKIRKGVSLINGVITLGFLGALGYGAAIQAKKSLAVMERTGTASDLPLPVTLKTILVIGVALMAIQALVHLIRNLKGQEE